MSSSCSAREPILLGKSVPIAALFPVGAGKFLNSCSRAGICEVAFLATVAFFTVVLRGFAGAFGFFGVAAML